ncbi:MAG TPA: DUF2150 family protein [Methanosarcinaceae archaeon]|nr:DUF2150 family protein [Methanosarcinaceae archaeon]
MPDKGEEQIHHEFYTNERWNNWIKQVQESGFELTESDESSGKNGDIFVNMEDDIILACLKVIAKFDRGILSSETAFEAIAGIRNIVLAKIEPISEDIDLMIDSLQTSLMGGFAACECYIEGDFEKKPKMKDLIKSAIEAEAADDVQIALGHVARIGAAVINGKKLSKKALENIPYGFVAEWLDGIESIAAAMVGADSYKKDDE